MAERTRGGDALSQRLRELRAEHGLRQADAARAAGMSQSLVAKFETGRQVPKQEQVQALCRTYRASRSEEAALKQTAADLREENKRVVLRRSPVPAQKRIGRILQASAVQRTFSPSGLPGLLQTPAYAQALFRAGGQGEADADEAAEARLASQDAIDTDREFYFVLPEGSLGWALLPGEDMAAQMDQLIAASARPNVHLGIIPWGCTVPELPLNSWTEFDERLVIVGTMTRVAHLTSRGELDEYRRLFDELDALAVHDDEARAILAATAERYRNQRQARTAEPSAGPRGLSGVQQDSAPSRTCQ